eukprot:4798273-Prymnesium_polylepis.1
MITPRLRAGSGRCSCGERGGWRCGGAPVAARVRPVGLSLSQCWCGSAGAAAISSSLEFNSDITPA